MIGRLGNKRRSTTIWRRHGLDIIKRSLKLLELLVVIQWSSLLQPIRHLRSQAAVDSPAKAPPAAPPKQKKKMTVAEILDSYRQVNMEGLPCQAHIFDFNLQSTYNGAQEGGTIADMWLKNFIDTITEAIANSDDGLRLLPVDDSLYHDTSLWISSEEDVAKKIKSFRDLPNTLIWITGTLPTLLPTVTLETKNGRQEFGLVMVSVYPLRESKATYTTASEPRAATQAVTTLPFSVVQLNRLNLYVSW